MSTQKKMSHTEIECLPLVEPAIGGQPSDD